MQDGYGAELDARAGVILQPADDGLDELLAVNSGHRQGHGLLEGRLMQGPQTDCLLRSERVVIQVETSLEGESQKCGITVYEPQVKASKRSTASSKKSYSSSSRSECSRVRYRSSLMNIAMDILSKSSRIECRRSGTPPRDEAHCACRCSDGTLLGE